MRNLYYLASPEPQKNSQLAEEFRLKPLQEWIAALPKANYGLTIRMFDDRIKQMNAIKLEPEVLVEALDELHPVYLMAEEFLLSRLVGKSIPLNPDEQKIAQLAESLTKNYLSGYSVILREVAASTAGRRLARVFPRVICRLIRGLSRILLLHYLLRVPEPEWIWADLHSLYLLAEQKQKQGTKVKEDQEHKTVTAETLYKAIVLLRLADPWGLGHREMLDLYDNLEKWSETLVLSARDPEAILGGCVLYMDEDKAPLLHRDPEMEKDSHSRVYTLPLDNLLRKLSELEAVADSSVGRFDLVNADGQRATGEPAALLEYLRDRWSGIESEQHSLFADRKPRILSIGLKATHQQLSPPSSPNEKILSDWLVTVNEDQSLRCEFDQAGQIFLGSLVSLKVVDIENARRVLGVVNRMWMNRLDGAVHFQITVMSPMVLAAGIQPVRDRKDKKNKELLVFQRALLYFSETRSGRQANLLLESQKLKNGNTVQLLTHDETVKVLLENRKNVAPGCWRFECIPLAEEVTEEIPVKGYDFL
ncbi:MAG: hypothetical protein ACU843_09400 [Gammaproteobacteria bacterium]